MIEREIEERNIFGKVTSEYIKIRSFPATKGGRSSNNITYVVVPECV